MKKLIIAIVLALTVQIGYAQYPTNDIKVNLNYIFNGSEYVSIDGDGTLFIAAEDGAVLFLGGDMYTYTYSLKPEIDFENHTIKMLCVEGSTKHNMLIEVNYSKGRGDVFITDLTTEDKILLTE